MIYEHSERGLRRAIGYDAGGEGPAVLLLHPFPFSRGFWAATRAALAGHRTIAVDARGFGDSALGEPGFSVDDLAEDAVALLDHLGVPMAFVLGCSMGGYVALALAERHPARLAGLILVDTKATADGPEARANRDAAIAQLRDGGPGPYLDGAAQRMCSVSAGAEVRAEVQALAKASSPDPSRALPATLCALRDRPDRSALLPKLRVPSLVIVGSDDAIAPPDEARAMASAIPGAERLEIAGAGHLPPVERPQAFHQGLAAFLARV